MTHTDWHLDVYDPDYEPEPGSRVFVDLTRERALFKIRKQVELHWNNLMYPMSEIWNTKQDAVTALLEHAFEHGEHTPDIVTAEKYWQDYWTPKTPIRCG
jgi:hypothetical protein